MAEFDRSDIRGWLIKEIEAHCLATGEDEMAFCWKVTANSNFLSRLRDFKSPRIDTVQNILTAIDKETAS